MMMCDPNIATLSRSFKSYSSPQRNKNAISDLHTLKKFLLEEIKEVKKALAKRTKQVEKIIGDLETVTWYKVEDKEGQTLIEGFLKIANEYYREEKKYFDSLTELKGLGNWQQELDSFENSLSDLEETLRDVESRFLSLDKVEGFKETMEELARL